MALRRVNDLHLVVESAGRGEPVVFVHGSWDDRQVWANVEADLVDRFHVVSYSRRGHGGSAGGPSPGSRREDEDDLAALIQTLGLVPAHVVANSFGASIALGMAGRRADLLRSLCVHEPPLFSLVADDPVAGALQSAVAGVVELIERGEPEKAARTFVETVLGPGAWDAIPADERAGMTGHAATFADEQQDPTWADIDLAALAEIAVPVLLTQGDQSPSMFSIVNARLADALECAHVRTLSGVGHVPQQTHPAYYSAALRGFLTGSTSVA